MHRFGEEHVLNEGVIARDINNSAVAGGRGARASTGSDGQRAGQQAHIAALLRQLQEALTADGGQLGDAREDVAEQVAAVEKELDAEQPGKRAIVRSLLKGIADDAKAVTSIVNATNALLTALHPHLS